MKRVPKISESEWEVMVILWNQSPLTANDVYERLKHHFRWKPNTVKTLISRLVAKEALDYKKDGKTNFYFPAVSQDECVRAASRSFLKRIYGGSLQPMLVHFLEEEKLSSEEIEELKRILAEKSQGQ